MKKYLFTLLLMGAMVVFWEPSARIIAKFLVQEEPTTREISRGDWLSKVAKKHYGDASYWRELALVNRAPNADLIFPEEEVIIPSFSAIRKIRKARSMSVVNQLVDEQRNVLAGKSNENYEEPVAVQSEPIETKEITSDPVEQSDFSARESQEEFSEPVTSEENQGITLSEKPILDEENDSFWASTPMITAYVIFAVMLIIGAIMFYRNKKRDEVAYYGDTEEKEEEKQQTNLFSFGNRENNGYENNSKNHKKEREKELVS